MFGSVLLKVWYPMRLLDRQPENSQVLSQGKDRRYTYLSRKKNRKKELSVMGNSKVLLSFPGVDLVVRLYIPIFRTM